MIGSFHDTVLLGAILAIAFIGGGYKLLRGRSFMWLMTGMIALGSSILCYIIALRGATYLTMGFLGSGGILVLIFVAYAIDDDRKRSKTGGVS